MIKTREELKSYLRAECDVSRINLIRRFLGRPIDYGCKEVVAIRRFLKVYRTYEYYYNQGAIFFILKLIYRSLFAYYSSKLNIGLRINCIEKGLTLWHTYKTQTIVAGKVGRNVTIRPGVVLAYQGDWRNEDACPIVEDFVEFSFGVKAFGPIRIGRGSLICANAVLFCNVPPYSIVAGNPGKVIGFVKTPSQVVEFEKKEYPECERLSLEYLEMNYEKFFISRINEINTFIGLQ